MGKTANEIEIERQKSQMINKGYNHNDINDPNKRVAVQQNSNTNKSGK